MFAFANKVLHLVFFTCFVFVFCFCFFEFSRFEEFFVFEFCRADGWSLRGRRQYLYRESVEEGCGQTKVKHPPPYTSDSNHLHNHANRARKSWRSDVLIILAGWERLTGGSRSIPTVHPCGTLVRRLWVAQSIYASRAQTSNPTGGSSPAW